MIATLIVLGVLALVAGIGAAGRIPDKRSRAIPLASNATASSTQITGRAEPSVGEADASQASAPVMQADRGLDQEIIPL